LTELNLLNNPLNLTNPLNRARFLSQQTW